MSKPDLTFGPDGDQWHYTRETKTYDLTRGSQPTFEISTTQGIPETKFIVNPTASALVIVDMQNYFLDKRCRDHPKGLAAVEPTLRVIQKCREIGLQVIWLNWGLTETDVATLPASVQRGFSRSLIAADQKPVRAGLGANLGDGKGRCLVAGSWNAEIYGPLAEAVDPDADVRCAKNRMSGLWNEEQPLWKHLTAAGKKTLFFTGVNTDQCVLGTLTNAYNAGWDCVLIEDCCGTPTEWGKEVCEHNIAASYGFIVDSNTFVSGESTRAAA